MSFKKEVHEYASDTIDAIERYIDRQIWRTRRRIHELIVQEKRIVSGNPFLENQNMFLYLLMGFSFSGEIQAQPGKRIYNSGEKWEEGETEAILFEDLDEGENEPYVTTIEQFFHKGLNDGLAFGEIRENIRINPFDTTTLFQNEMRKQGVCIGNIFYKKPLGGRGYKKNILPQLPAYIG